MEERLRTILKAPAVVTITDNTRSMISFRRRDQAYHVRLNHIFLDADEDVLKAVAEFISKRSVKARGIIRGFIRQNGDRIRKRPVPGTRRPRIRHQGRYFNLLESFTTINEGYFDGLVDCPITWGRHVNRTRRGLSVRLGSYSPGGGVIRINPILDRRFVPLYVLEAVIHHEMVHSRLGFRYAGGRRMSHYPEFRAMEKRYMHQEEAEAWIKKNLNLLTGKS